MLPPKKICYPDAMAQYVRKDRLYQRAKREGLLSRAAYKLEELDRRYRLLRRGAKVLDLGCWPGGWSQVALRKVGREGRVVGIDLKPVEGLLHPRFTFLQADLQNRSLNQELLERFGEFDLILSDASPSLTGIAATDSQNALALVEAVIKIGGDLLKSGGDLVLKFFPSGEMIQQMTNLRDRFRTTYRTRLESSRRGSSEHYFVGISLKSRPSPEHPPKKLNLP